MVSYSVSFFFRVLVKQKYCGKSQLGRLRFKAAIRISRNSPLALRVAYCTRSPPPVPECFEIIEILRSHPTYQTSCPHPSISKGGRLAGHSSTQQFSLVTMGIARRKHLHVTLLEVLKENPAVSSQRIGHKDLF